MTALQALDRARRAWERTSPQLVIDGWLDMMDRLDETQHGVECRPLRLVEPARSHRTPPRAGSPLAPNHAANQDEGLTAHRSPFAADTATSVSSAPYQYDGGCRISPEESRGSRQRGV